MSSVVVPTFGDGTTAHALPFHCCTSVWALLLPEVYPTAQQSTADAHATLSSTLVCVVPAFGDETIAHALPFHCSMSVCGVLPLTE